jgi:phosphatidate cytidylyltransferase|tara:strand:- start:1262 stop:1915 length:654 start_codon:yes stop_codon:yes gene_type:complete
MTKRIFWGTIYALAIFWICNAETWSPLILIFPLISICLEFIRMKKLKTLEKLTGISYVILSGCSIWSISELSSNNNTSIIFIIFILIWISDSMAYLGGKFLGKTPLAIELSPKKTWEGAIIGFLFTFFIGLLGLVEIDPFSEFQSIKSWQRISWALPLTIGIVAPIGDLIGSKFKRLAKVKDSGIFLPGHGGFLDRFDSFLFSVIVVAIFQSYILIP